jgi:hypothetical protein
MSVITGVSPTASIKLGNVPIEISGSGFITTDKSFSFTTTSGYTTSVIASGLVSAPSLNGVSLSVGTLVGSYAAVYINDTFDKVFDLELELARRMDTLPAIDEAVVFAMKAEDEFNPQTGFKIELLYKDSIGYYVRTEGSILNTLVHRQEHSLGPYKVTSLRLFRSENKITAYIKVDGNWIKVGAHSGFGVFRSKISSYISNSPTMHTGAFSVSIKKFTVKHAVSYINEPAIITSLSATQVLIRTQAGSVSAGGLWIGFPDGSIVQAPGVLLYTEGELRRSISLYADMAVSVFQQYIQPSRSDLFTQAGGFTWDEDELLANSKKNTNLFVPSLWDARTFSIEPSFFQSGYGFDNDIELQDIVKVRRQSEEKWHAQINHGTYYIQNSKYYLYSEQSVTTRLEGDKLPDGRSLKNLLFLPKPGVPIAISTLMFDHRSGNIVEKKQFTKRIKFTGRASNGVELDTAEPSNIDPMFYEYKVHYNSNNMRVNWRIPVGVFAPLGRFTFQLPEIPLFEYSVIFTRPDIFRTQKYVAKNYGDSAAIYGRFKYGTGIQQPGDWMVDYNSGEVTVWLEQDYVDIGFVTYTFAYPAIIEFNNEYVVDKGSAIRSPTPSNLAELDTLGESSEMPNETFICDEFPILDLSHGEYFDTTSFNVFLYNPYTLTFDNSWRRVKTFADSGPNDKTYILESDVGTIRFGNGINGKIPEKYLRIVMGYRVCARVEYEPISSVDYWTAKSIDLNLSRNNLDSGFLHLTRREQIPASIALEFADAEISSLEYTSIRARVYDVEGEPMPGVPVKFEIVSLGGQTEDEIINSDSDGLAETTFLPSSSIESMGIFIQPFTAGSDAETKGDLISNAYQNNGNIVNAKLITGEVIVDSAQDIYLFKILDKGDAFTPYDNLTRKGGVYQVYYEYDSEAGQNVLVRPSAVSGKILIFDNPLPQSHDPVGPNYDPAFRGFCVIAKKRTEAVATTVYNGIYIRSQIAFLRVAYAPIQKGEWTLPILPASFDGSEIDRATYITINP